MGAMNGMSAMAMAPPAMAALGTVAMMVAMMLPSIAPTLWRYHRQLLVTRVPLATRRTAIVAVGYVGVWSTIALVLFAIDMALPRVGLPRLAAGTIVLCAGALQRSRWKAAQLHRCIHACGAMPSPPSKLDAWRTGGTLGVHCALSCAAAMTVLLVAGLMDMRVMIAITAAISAERLAPAGARIAQMTGTMTVVIGLGICIRAVA